MTALLLSITALAWDGEFLYVARPGGVDVYREGKRVRSLGDDKRKVMALAARGKRLAEGGGRAGERGEVRVWEGEKLLHRIEIHGDLVYRVAWSDDGRLLYTAGGDAKVGVIEAETGRVLECLEGHTGPVLALAARGDVVVSGGADRTIRVWKERKLVRTIANHWEAVHALAFSPDGRYLASGSADRTVRVWQPEIGRLVRIVKGHDGAVLDLAWTEKRLASASADGKVRLIEPDGVAILRTVEGSDWITSLADGPRLTAGDASGRLLEVPE